MSPVSKSQRYEKHTGSTCSDLMNSRGVCDCLCNARTRNFLYARNNDNPRADFYRDMVISRKTRHTDRSDRANKIYRRDICIIRGISKHPRDTSIFRRATPFAPDPYPAVPPVRYNTPGNSPGKRFSTDPLRLSLKKSSPVSGAIHIDSHS